jgi:microcystin-dependent protein
VLAISIGMIYIIIKNKNLESNLKKNDILDAQHYEYLQKLVNTAVYKFNSFDPTKVVQPIGTVICFAGINIPSNYMLCDGTKLLIAEYSDLFKVIGQMFNQSDTDSTLYFNLPDLRGQFVRGLDNNKGIDIGRVLGTYQNDSTKLPNKIFSTNVQGNHTHTTDVQGNHTHWCSSAPRDDGNGSGCMNHTQMYGLWADSESYSTDDPRYQYGRYIVPAGAHSHTTTTAGSHSHTVTSGGDIETRPKNISLNYIIKTSI